MILPLNILNANFTNRETMKKTFQGIQFHENYRKACELSLWR